MQTVYFGRFLHISPRDQAMASKALTLLDSILQVLKHKNTKSEILRTYLSSLTCLLENVTFTMANPTSASIPNQ